MNTSIQVTFFRGHLVKAKLVICHTCLRSAAKARNAIAFKVVFVCKIRWSTGATRTWHWALTHQVECKSLETDE